MQVTYLLHSHIFLQSSFRFQVLDIPEYMVPLQVVLLNVRLDDRSRIDRSQQLGVAFSQKIKTVAFVNDIDFVANQFLELVDVKGTFRETLWEIPVQNPQKPAIAFYVFVRFNNIIYHKSNFIRLQIPISLPLLN